MKWKILSFVAEAMRSQGKVISWTLVLTIFRTHEEGRIEQRSVATYIGSLSSFREVVELWKVLASFRLVLKGEIPKGFFVI